MKQSLGQDPAATTSSSTGGLTPGLKALIGVLATVAGIAGIMLLVVFWLKRQRKKRHQFAIASGIEKEGASREGSLDEANLWSENQVAKAREVHRMHGVFDEDDPTGEGGGHLAAGQAADFGRVSMGSQTAGEASVGAVSGSTPYQDARRIKAAYLKRHPSFELKSQEEQNQILSTLSNEEHPLETTPEEDEGAAAAAGGAAGASAVAAAAAAGASKAAPQPPRKESHEQQTASESTGHRRADENFSDARELALPQTQPEAAQPAPSAYNQDHEETGRPYADSSHKTNPSQGSSAHLLESAAGQYDSPAPPPEQAQFDSPPQDQATTHLLGFNQYDQRNNPQYNHSQGQQYSPGQQFSSGQQYSPGQQHYTPAQQFSPGQQQYSPAQQFSPGQQYSPGQRFSLTPGQQYNHSPNSPQGPMMLSPAADVRMRPTFHQGASPIPSPQRSTDELYDPAAHHENGAGSTQLREFHNQQGPYRD